jgi:beta-lactamase superfamily II metal-dependent hydrolase
MNRTCLLVLLISLALLASACDATPTPTPDAPPPSDGGTLTVAFLDIGQGDSILLRSPGGMTMLIDGGNSDRDAREVIIPQLQAWGADKLDVMISTQPDADHMGGLPGVLENFPVVTVAFSGQVHTTKTYERFLTDVRDLNVSTIKVRTGTAIPFDPALTIEVVWPEEEFVQDEDDRNNASVVFRLTYGQVSFLFTGDAEGPAERAILTSGAGVNSTILKVGHHGSRTSTSEDFLAAIDPQIAVISAGEGNQYGHPHQEVLDRLNRAGVQVYRTDLSGTITITTDGSTIDVATDR